MRIVFFGSSDFAIPSLKALKEGGFAPELVVTKPDAPKGRGRKIYEITEEGRKHLAEHSQTVDGIFDRIARFVDGFLDAPMMEVNQAFKRVGRATYGLAPGHLRNRELLDRLKGILDRAADEIEALGRESRAEKPTDPAP